MTLKTIDTSKNIFTCNIGVDDPYSCLGGYEKQAGIFSFDFDSYLAESCFSNFAKNFGVTVLSC